jgi:two-component system, OmpR family, phosphate regulon sensor histidine kinase PhoR
MTRLTIRLMPIMTDSGETGVVMVAVDDVTRLRYLETVRRDFVANVSHELRTPTASINLLVETPQRGAVVDPDAVQQFLHRTGVETQAMAHLVEELLKLSRLETGRGSKFSFALPFAENPAENEARFGPIR